MPATKFKNCLFDACKIHIEVFRMTTDGRKWKAAAGNRKTLLIQLAGYANADGTSIRPSTQTLADQSGFSRSKVCRLLDDLKTLGLCERVGRYGQRGAAIRKLMLPAKPSGAAPENPIPRVPDSISQSVTFDSESVRFNPESVRFDSQSVTAMTQDLPSDLPNRPVNQIKRLTDGFFKTTGKVLGIKQRDYQAYADLEKEHGEEVVYRSVVKEFANADHNWNLVKNPSRLYLSDPSEYLATARIKQRESERVYETVKTDWTDEFQPKEDTRTPDQILASRYSI